MLHRRTPRRRGPGLDAAAAPGGLGVIAAIYLIARLRTLNARTENLDQLALHNERITTALDHMSQGLCMFDADKNLIVCNERYAEMYGISPELVQPGTPFRQILKNRIDNGRFMVGNPEDYIRERIASVEERVASVKVQQLTDGRSIAISHCPLEEGGWVATHDDITEIRRIEAQIAHMAHHDGLTDLPNRVLFREELDRALERAKRGEQLWVLCLDLDHFKAVNDTLGHPVGDELLKTVAERLAEDTRDCDIVARLGGDEFAVLLPRVRAETDPVEAAARITSALDQPFVLHGVPIAVEASIGIAVYPEHGTDVEAFGREVRGQLEQQPAEDDLDRTSITGNIPEPVQISE
jgi:diguanylate cyclase (GGDEF)-like protein